MTTVLVQVMLVVTLFSADAFNFALDLTSALTLIPFLLAAAYALKLVATRETYDEAPRGYGRELVVAVLATLYCAFLLFAAGPKFILVSFIIYAPATILFVMARREQGRRLFSPRRSRSSSSSPIARRGRWRGRPRGRLDRGVRPAATGRRRTAREQR